MLKNKDYMHKDCVKPLFYHGDLCRISLRGIKGPVSVLGGCKLVELDINYSKTIFNKKNSPRGNKKELYFLPKFTQEC